MAVCVDLAPLRAGLNDVKTVSGAVPNIAISTVPASKVGDEYSCASGGYLLMTVEEVNAPPSLPITPAQFAQAYGWGLGTVLVLWAIGWGVGVLVGVIRKA